MRAEARRLACLNVELSQPLGNLLSGKHKTLESKLNQASLDKLDIAKPTYARCSSNTDNLIEIESLESSQLVGVDLLERANARARAKERLVGWRVGWGTVYMSMSQSLFFHLCSYFELI